ncbi:MAG: hypothetical protein ACRENZ_00060 [Thermodesulfobacteriota bacterium]
MITIFSCPKPFRGHINIIQRNAIRSWTLLQPAPEITLIGEEEGIAQVCLEFSLHHIHEVERNEHGTPLVNALFAEAEKVARYPLMCYVNTDIIFMSDFLPAVERALREKPGSLMVGRRWDLDIREPLDFSKNWEAILKTILSERGKIHLDTGIDFFVFPKGIWGEIPPFALGRTVWDNWLIYGIRSQKIPVVDLTEMLIVVHQDHDYAHYPGGIKALWEGEEAKNNLELAGGYAHAYTLKDTTHRLTKKGVRRKIFVPVLSYYYRLINLFFINLNLINTGRAQVLLEFPWKFLDKVLKKKE